MKYFTAAEAKRVLDNSSLLLASFWADNPNLEAIRAVTEKAECVRIPTVYTGVVYGFLFGMATGIRTERAKRRGKV